MCEHNGEKFWKNIEERCPSWGAFVVNKDGYLDFIGPNFPEGAKSYEDLTDEQMTQIYQEKNKITSLPITLEDIRRHICAACGR